MTDRTPGTRGGSTRRGRKIRAEVLARDGHACTLRIPGVCTGVATSAHHTIGWIHGDDPARMQAACMPCNLHVGDPLKADPMPLGRTQW